MRENVRGKRKKGDRMRSKETEENQDVVREISISGCSLSRHT